MTTANEATVVARQRADKRIDSAIGELHAAALAIGKKYDIPEGVAGHSVDELLGRMAYVPTMARDLRRACGQELAQQELKQAFGDLPGSSKRAPKTNKPNPPVIDPSKIAANVPVSLDIGQLDGITTQTVKALRAAGLNKVGDIVTVPDEHLHKMQGLGEKSVAQIRVAIANAASPSSK